MKNTEKVELLNAKLQWRAEMRKFFGQSWTKRTASKMFKDGRKMNVFK